MDCCNAMNTAYVDTEYGPAFEAKESRSRFVMKVYALLSTLLIITAIQVGATLLVDEVKTFFIQNIWLMWLALGIYFIVSIILMCAPNLLRQPGLNLFLLALLVESLTVICCIVTIFYETSIVINAVACTGILCFSVSIIAIIMPIDLTKCGLCFLILGLSLTIFAVVTIIVTIFFSYPFLNIIFSFSVVIVIGLFLAFETQLLFGGRYQELDAGDIVAGALVLYVNIIVIFMHLLNILNYFSN